MEECQCEKELAVTTLPWKLTDYLCREKLKNVKILLLLSITRSLPVLYAEYLYQVHEN